MIEFETVSLSLSPFSLSACSFTIHDGDYYCIMGPSGAGKTVLLELIAGLYLPDSGMIKINGRDASSIPPEKRNIGIVYQDYALFPHLTVKENICYGMQRQKIPAGERNTAAEELADRFGISHLLDRNASALSGGEAQRTALARALAVKPEILLVDEPFSALDPVSKERCIRDLQKLHRDGLTIVQVTHSRAEAFDLADRIAILEGGRVLAEGTTDEIFMHPKNRKAAEFIGYDNFITKNSRVFAVKSDDVILSRDDAGICGIVRSVRPAGAVTVYTVETSNGIITAAMGKRETSFSTGERVAVTYAGAVDVSVSSGDEDI